MGFDMQQAETCLQSLDLVTLFRDVLGWVAPGEGRAIAARAFNHPYRAQCIAQRGNTRIWEIRLSPPATLTVRLKARLYQAIHKKYPRPLIIFIDRQRDRSLWHWQCQADMPQSLVFIPQQPLGAWHARLNYLADYDPSLGALDLQPRSTGFAELAKQLQHQLNQLSESIIGISNGGDRRWYAAVLLQRLIVVHRLQQRGFLDGDIWYLHSQLGRSQQRQQNGFFQQVLQPLFLQGFSLPMVERPRALSWVGHIPYLGDMFYTHRLERQYADINIDDAAFEAILVWFESPLWQQVSWQTSLAFEQVLAAPPGHSEPGTSEVATVEILGICCDRILNQFMLRQLGIEPTSSAPDFWDILFCGQIEHLRQLVQTILPRLSILDPACGTGTLLAVMQHRLIDIYGVLIGHLHHCPDSQLNIWLKGLQAESPSLLQTICRRILTSLYGVDINPVAVDIARLQLSLGLVAIAQQPQDIEPLPSLDFNIVTGNSLVGLIRVDEAGFDRLQAPETILQGNLLQPLAAETYRTILSEKNIALEHYRSQAYVLEELQQEIPHYAQLEFFRTHINRLDARAQAKLNKLLLSEFSQTLGIQFKESQLTNPPRRRRLRIEDLEVLQPFHWGYHFNHVLAQTGFDIILSRPPQGPFRPTTQEFLQRFQDLASQKNINIRTFKTAKRSLLNTDPETANAWLFYHSQYAFVTDYFYRSPEYDHQSPLIQGKRQRTQLRQPWLFIERCFNLLAPQGICGLIVADDIRDSPRGVALRSLLETQTDSRSLVGLPSQQRASNQCFLWFCKR